jgi:hypothetical protein
MKLRSPRLLLLFCSVIAIGCLAYTRHYQFAAKIWHLRHGYTASVGDYEIPVPDRWLPTGSNPEMFTMMNAGSRPFARDTMEHTAAVITILPDENRPIGVEGLESWLSVKRQELDRERVASIEEKRIDISGDPGACIGGLEPPAAIPRGRIKTGITSLECNSASGLRISFVGEPSDVPPFYSFLSQIRKRK